MKDYLHHNHDPVKEQSLNSVALMATVHCLSGCAIGEIAGMVIGTALGWSNAATITLAIALAFMSGYLLIMLPILRAGYNYKTAMRIAIAADTASLTIKEIVDNMVMLIIPGAMKAAIDSLLFWGSLATALIIAGIATFPVNRWLIARGRGHALAHVHH
ncbi:DUF4396 domain-containing protein [Nitrosomonas supralitoralis]|uniref:DUF4396 domain-containing protein n=1 Tax=Nitrosomonas supralitoralis TaxID=2116706 RepID=A0A2P7NW38_9PROT|nr:DUF4396 domain-containing protein [Nitrosomonas supralitoralis]PSJ17682.1 hypothetical protein C7H79_06625 [Nitrosomonas supralitoralis]